MDSLGKYPNFNDLCSFLEFVGEGEQRLFGYTSSLVSYVPLVAIAKATSQHRDFELQDLREHVDNLTSSLQQQRCEVDNI